MDVQLANALQGRLSTGTTAEALLKSAPTRLDHTLLFFLVRIYTYIIYQSRTLGHLYTLPPSSNVHHPLNECSKPNFPDAMEMLDTANAHNLHLIVYSIQHRQRLPNQTSASFFPLSPTQPPPTLHISLPLPFLPTTTVPCVGPLVVTPPTGFAAACDQSASSSPSRTYVRSRSKESKKSYSAS